MQPVDNDHPHPSPVVMTHSVHRIGLIIGSARSPGNNAGLASWISRIIRIRFHKRLAGASERTATFKLVIVDSTVSSHVFGALTDGSYTPNQIRKASDYPSPAVREWSTFVSSCSGFVILTPQYNGGYPGGLKNTIDHLYWEWKDKPVVIVSYGGSGGGSSAAQLRGLLERIGMKVAKNTVPISVPKQFMEGKERIEAGAADHKFPPFLSQYRSAVDGAIEELMTLVEKSTA